MVLSVTVDRLLKNLPPDVILEPNYFFFEFLVDYADESSNETMSDRSILLQKFTKYVIHDLEYRRFKKKELESIFNNLLSRLKNIIAVETSDVVEFNWEHVSKFFSLLKHIKKSNERILQWTVYHIFSKGQKEIQISELNKYLIKFNIKNLDGLLQNVVDDAKNEGLRIKYENSKIIIDHKNNDPVIKKCLADMLEFYFRRPRRKLESEILDLLDFDSYSNQELSELLNTDKSQISKAITKLIKSEEIKFSDFGERGSRYYITNCSNCPFGTNFESCRRDAIESISTILKDELDIQISTEDLKQIKHNQSLLSIEDTLLDLKKNKKTKLADETNESLRRILDRAIQNSIKQQTAKGSKYANLQHILDKTPTLYKIGFTQGTANGINLIGLVLSRIDPQLAKKLSSKSMQAKLLRELGQSRTSE